MRDTSVGSSATHGTAVNRDSSAGDGEQQRLVSVAKAAWILGEITDREVYRMLDRGQLTGMYHGRRRLVLRESIDAYIADRLAAARKGSAA